MKKLPARAGRFLLPLILTFLMTCIISGLSTILALGNTPGLLAQWARAWMSSWAVAFPTMLFVLPMVQRLLRTVLEQPEPASDR